RRVARPQGHAHPDVPDHVRVLGRRHAGRMVARVRARARRTRHVDGSDRRPRHRGRAAFVAIRAPVPEVTDAVLMPDRVGWRNAPRRMRRDPEYSMSTRPPGAIRRFFRAIWNALNFTRRLVFNLIFLFLLIAFFGAMFGSRP